MAKEKPIKTLEEKLSEAANYSLPAHLMQIQQISEQRLKVTTNTPAPSMIPHVEPSAAAEGDANQESLGGPTSRPTAELDTHNQGEEGGGGLPQASSVSPATQQELDQQANNTQKTLDLLDLYVDAKDSVNNWCVARIIDHKLQAGRITIHFDGWSPRYDEEVRITSSRIAAFRKYTAGYTGQTRAALRDHDLNYAHQVTLINHMQKIAESEFQCFESPLECTQFLRGELFVYFDSLVTLTTHATQADIQRIYEFTTEVFKLCLKWIDVFPKYAELYKQCQRHPNLFAVDTEAAVACCGQELFLMMQKCFGLCARSTKFFRQFAAYLSYPTEHTDPARMPENALMLSLVGQFISLGGFQKLQQLIKIGATGPDFKCPVLHVGLAIQTISRIVETGIQKPFAHEYLNQMADCVEEYLSPENLKDADIKEISLEELKRLIRQMASLKSAASGQDRYKVVELYELEIAKRFLMCPYFEKRIKGMKEFGEIHLKVSNKLSRTPEECQQVGVDYARYLDLDSFSAWIIDNKVLHFIFQENPHSELIKRSGKILHLMALKLETFPEEIIHIVWGCCSPEKHEDIVRAGYELIPDLARWIPLPRLETLSQQILSIPIAHIDDKCVEFLKTWTINTLANLKQKRQQLQKQGTQKHGSESVKGEQHSTGSGLSQMFGRNAASSQGKRATLASSSQASSRAPLNEIDDSRFFNLLLFWDIAQDSNVHASNRTKELALSALIEVLGRTTGYNSTMRDPFIQLTIDNIQRGETVYFSVGFFLKLLGTYPRDDQQMGSSHGRQRYGGGRGQAAPDITVEALTGQVLKKFDLYAIVITQAAAYMKHVKEAAQQNPALLSSAQLSSHVFKDGTTHEEYIRIFMRFVESIVINSRSITLNFQHVQEMFKIFVTEAVAEVETREFFNFLTKQNQNARTRERLYLLDEKLRFQVFTKIMCNDKSMNCLNLNLHAYECFRALFVGVNAQEGSLALDREGNILTVANHAALQGMNTMWRISIQCQNEEVKELCRCSLCDLYLLTKPKSQSQRQKAHDHFVKACRTQLVAAQEQRKCSQEQRKKPRVSEDSNQTIFNCLRLLKTFIQRYDKEHLIPELKHALASLSPQDQRNVRRVAIKLDPDGVRSEVEVNLNCKFWELMRQSASLLSLKMSEIYIFTRQGPLPDNVYNEYMKDYDLKEVQFQRKPVEELERESPSYVIGYQKDCLEVFLEVLKNHEDSTTNEAISLLELLQINPKYKAALSENIGKLKDINARQAQISTPVTEDAGQGFVALGLGVEDAEIYNFKEWSQMLKWERGGELNQTLHMLTCLKELTSGKPGEPGGYGGPHGNTSIVQQAQVPQQAEQARRQERLARLELQKSLLCKGGFHFLLHMFSCVNKEVDLEKDILTSKILQLLISLLSSLHSAKLQPLLGGLQKPQQLNELIGGCLTIVDSFLETTIRKQRMCYEELLSTQRQALAGNAAGHEILQSQSQQLNAATMELIYNQLQHRPVETFILTASLNFLTKILTGSPGSFTTLAQNEKFFKILKRGLIDVHQRKVQEKVEIFTQNLCSKIEKAFVDAVKTQSASKVTSSFELPSGDLATQVPSFLVLERGIKEFIPLSLHEQSPQKMRTLYRLLNRIFVEGDVAKSLDRIEDPCSLVGNLVKMIFEREIKEATSRDEDIVLGGLFDFLGKILARFPIVRQNLSEKKKMIEFLTHQGLFKKEKRIMQALGPQAALPPICKNPTTRNSCLELLRILCLDDLQDKLYVTSYLKQNVCDETFWRTPRKVDWTIHVQQQERAICGFVGLKNLGNICYMNSILQQLYMIPAFRKAIIEVEDRNHDQTPPEENVLYQIKCIFGGLSEVEKQYFNPKKFCRAFKDIDGSPIDPMVQKDVDEFFNMLMDRIENLIKGTKEEKVVKNLFQGVLANELICKGCPHYSEREELFCNVMLQVKNKSSVEESLKFYVEGEMLEGDNAYYCEKCEKKVSTLKRCCIKRMPNTLFLVLKRFEFDFDTMQKVKVNDFCEFPTELNMAPYSQQELTRQDLIKKMEEKNLSQDDLNEDELHILKRKVPGNYYEYKLKGIVVHHGTADQGHYYSFIQDREDKNAGWFEFNDAIVKDFAPNEIPEETYGGEDQNLDSNMQEMQNNGQVDPAVLQAMSQFRKKIKNAYVVIYERVELYDMAKVNDIIDDIKAVGLPAKELNKLYANSLVNPKQSQQAALIPQIPLNVHDVILAKNKKFWLSKTIFSVDFIQQMYLIFKDIRIQEDQDYAKYADPATDLQSFGTQNKTNSQFEALKFVITFFLTVSLRAKDRTALPDYVALIREALNKNIGLCLWLIETFSSQDFIKEYFIGCPIHDMARFTQGLLRTAMQQVYLREKDQIGQFTQVLGQPGGALNFVRETQKDYIEDDIVVDGKNLKAGLDPAICSGCSRVNLVRLKSHTAQVPKLVILINSFIHMSTSQQYCLSKWAMTGQFWSIFSNFSMLGDQARGYLLQTRTLGRLLDIFLNQFQDNFFSKEATVQYQNKFRDQTLRDYVPLIVHAKDLYVGMDPERCQVQLSNAERKQIGPFLSPPTTFLTLAISNLARSCALVKQANAEASNVKPVFALDCLHHVPDKEEIELLQSHKNLRWWQPGSSKLARNSIALMFAHISTDNKEFTQEYIHHLINKVSQEASIYVRNFERPLLRVVQVNDKFQADRIKRVLQKLFELFKNSTSYYMQADAIMEMVVKLSFRCPLVAQALATQHADFCKLIERYSKENPTLPVGAGKNRVFKEGQLRWPELKSGFLNQQKLDWITNYTRQRTARFLQHLQRTPREQERTAKLAGANDFRIADFGGLSTASDTEATESEQASALASSDAGDQASSRPNKYPEELFDADDDMYNRSFEPGQKIDFQHNNTWYQGTSAIALDEMVKCVAQPMSNQNQNQSQAVVHWIELESDKLAPPSSNTSNDREHLHKFLAELYTFVNHGQKK